LLAGTCSVTACDNQATTVHVAPGTPSPQTYVVPTVADLDALRLRRRVTQWRSRGFACSTFVEVIGAVQPDLSIIASKVVAFGDSLGTCSGCTSGRTRTTFVSS
jgi:hypothetical protein